MEIRVGNSKSITAENQINSDNCVSVSFTFNEGGQFWPVSLTTACLTGSTNLNKSQSSATGCREGSSREARAQVKVQAS